MNVDWEEYARRVTKLEAEGMTRSDAQAIVDVEMRFEDTYLNHVATEGDKHDC